jgi:predicted nucleic acid-binding Zn ribbon protein
MTKKIWPRLVKELRKCILVCHNCHAEIHQGITKVPRNAIQFDELYSLYWVEDKHSDKCVCGNKKEIWKQTCSEKCTRVIRGIKISHSKTNLKWKDIDLINELKTQTISELSRSLGCGWDTVKRNYDKQKEVCNVNEVRHI